METELGLHGSEDVAFLSVEAGLLELRDHVSLPEPTEVSALGLGGALGESLGELCEILSLGEADDDSLCIPCVGDEDVRGSY